MLLVVSQTLPVGGAGTMNFTFDHVSAAFKLNDATYDWAYVLLPKLMLWTPGTLVFIHMDTAILCAPAAPQFKSAISYPSTRY